MRLWTLHPKYLDRRGLVALWREGLLAQAVLRGRTRGYTRHPQLHRFRSQRAQVGAIANYLTVVQEEATRRGYNFDAGKLARRRSVEPTEVTRGQLAFEWEHLLTKLESRDREWLERVQHVVRPSPHPSFRIVPGPVEDWEKVPTA